MSLTCDQPPVYRHGRAVHEAVVIGAQPHNRVDDLFGLGEAAEKARRFREALRLFRTAREQGRAFDVVLLDLMLPDRSGLELLPEIKAHDPHLPVVVITAHGNVEAAVRALKLGAFDYLPKPFEPDDLKQAVKRAFERRNRMQQGQESEGGTGANYHFENVIGESPAMQRVFRLVAHCAPTNSTVMLRGESGTGKELVARAVDAGVDVDSNHRDPGQLCSLTDHGFRHDGTSRDLCGKLTRTETQHHRGGDAGEQPPGLQW